VENGTKNAPKSFSTENSNPAHFKTKYKLFPFAFAPSRIFFHKSFHHKLSTVFLSTFWSPFRSPSAPLRARQNNFTFVIKLDPWQHLN